MTESPDRYLPMLKSGNDVREGIRKYVAFISYSHKDSEIAKWLHRSLERYVVPRRLRRGDPKIHRRPFNPVFLDEEELPISSSLSAKIQIALEQSGHLIVLCSPSAASSRYVNEEIRFFKELGREDDIHPLIIVGEPYASEHRGHEQEECFPQALRYRIASNGLVSDERVEPLAADLRPMAPPGTNAFLKWANWYKNQQRRRCAFLKLVAGLLHLNFADLMEREKARRRIHVVIGTVLVTTLATVGYLVAALTREALKEAARNFYVKQEAALIAAEQNAAYTGQYAEAALLNIRLLTLKNPDHEAGNKIDRLSRLRFYIGRIPQCQVFSSLPQTWRLVPGKSKNSLLFTNSSEAALLNLDTLTVSRRISLESATAQTWLDWNEETKRAAFWDANGRAYLMNLQTGKPEPIRPDTAAIWHVALGSVPQRLAFWSDNRPLEIQVGSADSRAVDLTSMQHPFRAVFDPAGNILAVTSINDDLKLALVNVNGDKTPVLFLQDWGEDASLLVMGVVFSPDGKRLACLTTEGVFVFSTNDGRRLAGPLAGGETTEQLIFSTDSKRLFIVRENLIDVWDFSGGQPRTFVAASFGAPVECVALNEDGAQMIVAVGDCCIVLSTINWTQLLPVFHTGATVNQVFSVSGNRIAFLAGGKELSLWGPPVQGLTTKLIEEPTPVADIVVKGQDQIITIDNDGRARVLSCVASSPSGPWQVRDSIEHCVAISPQGDTLICKDSSYAPARVVNSDHRSLKATGTVLPASDSGPLSRLTIAPSGKIAATAHMVGHNFQVYDLQSGRTLATRELPTTGFDKIIFSPDSERVAFAGADGNLFVLRSDESSSPILHARCGLGIRDVAFGPDGKGLAVASADGVLRFWNIASQPSRQTNEIACGYQSRRIEFSGDGHWFAALDFDAKFLSIWESGRLNEKPRQLSALKTGMVLPKISDFVFDEVRGWIWICGNNGSCIAFALESGEMALPSFGLDGTPIHCISKGMNSHEFFIGTDQGAYLMSMPPVSEDDFSSWDRALQLLCRSTWDVETGKLQAISSEHAVDLSHSLGLWRGWEQESKKKEGDKD